MRGGTDSQVWGHAPEAANASARHRPVSAWQKSLAGDLDSKMPVPGTIHSQSALPVSTALQEPRQVGSASDLILGSGAGHLLSEALACGPDDVGHRRRIAAGRGPAIKDGVEVEQLVSAAAPRVGSRRPGLPTSFFPQATVFLFPETGALGLSWRRDDLVREPISSAQSLDRDIHARLPPVAIRPLCLGVAALGRYAITKNKTEPVDDGG